jgi:DNA-binding NtrC family response regulator
MNASQAVCEAGIHHAEAPGRILVVDDHRKARESMADVLRGAGHRVDAVSSAVEALRLLKAEPCDLIITDLQMPGMSGLEFIRQLERQRHGAQVLMVTAHATIASAVEAMRHGAFDYLEKPFDAEALEQHVARALAHGRSLDQHSALAATPGEGPVTMIGASPAMQALRSRIGQIAATAETVLITGETGTGKELVARVVHALGDRRDRPLVSLNCPSLPDHLAESELFGHERGAFTGAEAARTGRFELADGGSIHLDEITEIGLSLQAKLLRVLQEKSFERVGASHTQRVDVRVLASTNRNLREEVLAGRFRADLYYRLAVVPLVVPPLRERRDDVPELVEHFLARFAQRTGRDPCRLAPDGLDLLIDYHWPGNIRELENIVTRACVLHSGGAVGAADLRAWLIEAEGQERPAGATPDWVGLSLEAMERKLIESTLDRFDGHRARTAEALGIGLRTLSGKLRQYGYAPRAKSFGRLA